MLRWSMVVVRCVCLGVVANWFLRLASNLVGPWRALVVFPVFVRCLFKLGNRHLITGRSHSTEDERNLPIVPVRGCLEKIRRLLKGDEYVGRGSSQRGLGRSPLRNSYKDSVFGRKLAVQKFTEEIRTNPKLREHLLSSIWKTLDMPLSAVAGVPRRQCHSRVQAAISMIPTIGRIRGAQFRPSAVLRRLSELRQEPESDGRWSSPDENVPEKGSGWSGRGKSAHGWVK